MTKINLRELFPAYGLDCYIEVSDEDIGPFLACLTKEVANVYIAFERAEAAYWRRLYWNRAHYSLDQDDGLENAVLHPSLGPAEVYERRLRVEQLYAAIASLPDKQAKRIYAYYFLGMSKAEIARADGVNKSRISGSIKKGLRKLKNIFEKY